MVSVQFDNIECAKMLIAKGATVGTKNNKGQTALHIACIFGCSDAVIPLLDFGADINEPDANGSSPVMLAAARSHNTVVALFLEKNPDLLLEDKGNSTALSLARENGLDLNLLSAIVFNREMQLQKKRSTPQELQSPAAKLHSDNISASATAAIVAANAALSRQDSRSLIQMNDKGDTETKTNTKTNTKMNTNTKTKTKTKPKKTDRKRLADVPIDGGQKSDPVKERTVGVSFDLDAIDAAVEEKVAKRVLKAEAERQNKGNELISGEELAMWDSRIHQAEERDFVEKEKNAIFIKRGWVPADGEVPMHPLNESEGNLAAIMLELNIDKDDMEVAGLNADKDLTSLATLEMERRMRIMSLNDANADKSVESRPGGGGGVSQDFEGSAVSSLTMNSLSSMVIQRKRQREREQLRKSRAAMAGQSDAPLNACLNPSLNCLENESLQDLKSPTDMLLLKKAKEANDSGAHYLRRLAAEKELNAYHRKRKSTRDTPRTPKQEGSSLSFLWCLAPLVEQEPEEKGANPFDDRDKVLVEKAYVGPPNDENILSDKDKALQAQGVRAEEEEDVDEAPKFGIMVNTEMRRDIDNHHPIPHKEMLRRLKKLKRKERREAVMTQVMCGVHEQRNSNRRVSAVLNNGSYEEEGGCVVS